MKQTLTLDLVSKMTLSKQPTLDERRKLLLFEKWEPAPWANYLVYDDSRDAPVGFAIRVGRKASPFLVEKMVAGKKMKIHVGLARGRMGAELVMSLAEARAPSSSWAWPRSTARIPRRLPRRSRPRS